MITLKDFFKGDKKLAIHCDTEEKANVLLKYFDKMGKKWCNGVSYLRRNNWETHEEETCYSNDRRFGRKEFYQGMNYKIYEFEDVILADKMQTIILSDDELKIINDALELYDERATEGLMYTKGKQKKEIENTLKKINELQKKLEVK